MQRERVINRKLHQVTEFYSLEHFVGNAMVPPGISTIFMGGIPVDFLISPGSSRTTIFFFHGAIEPHFTLPVLSGLGISGELDANRVFISDPSLVLHKELMLSWYAGNMYQPALQQQLVMVMKKIVKSLGTERNVFFGGSGGGFAALYYSSYFPESLALVFNPQTNIANYAEKAVRDYAHRAFRVNPTSPDPIGQLPPSLTYDLCVHYSAHLGNSVAYMQNLQDETHMRDHLAPFLEAVHPDIKLKVFADTWREGHTPPPKSMLTGLLSELATSADWDQILFDSGFRTVTTRNIED